MKQSNWREALPAMSLGWELAIPIFLGVLLGYYGDQWLGTKPFLTLGFLLLGAATSIYNVVRFALRLEARAKSEKQVKGD
ncbi:MAG: AtpZ/AtpI family protein [Anaerolineae bacterium]